MERTKLTHDEQVEHLRALGYEPFEITEIMDSLGWYTVERVPVILAHFPDADAGWVEFVGQDSCAYAWDSDDTPCAGWDGYSRRCNCGNRRVYWVVDGDWAYGMAD